MKKMKPNKLTRWIIALSLVSAFAFWACALTETAKKSTALPSLAVEGSGMPGKALKIKGEGFVPGETIELVLEMDAVPIIVGERGKVIKVNENGAFLAQTNYPHKLVAVAGFWDLLATGDKGSQASCKVEIKQP